MTGTVLGKQVLEVKVIASPGRDAGKDEKKFLAEQKSLSSLSVVCINKELFQIASPFPRNKLPVLSVVTKELCLTFSNSAF